ncbi:MAG: hypothetical protein F4X64_10835 [Chloroflexi bacterium]|nr:hypothetical protein [Chloroflexota bacterium]
MLVALLAVALALRLYGINWDDGHGFHPDERSFYLRAGDMLCLLTAGPDADGPYCSAAHLRSLLAGDQFQGIEPGLPDLGTALSAERSPLNPRWFPLGSALIYALVLLRTLLEPFVDWGVMELRFAGRTLAGLADVGSVWLLYLIGRRMYGRWTGILAAALTTFAVIHIQHAHFYRPEPFTVLASLGALWAMLRFIESGRGRDAALLGALVGLAMAPKISVAPILAPLVLTFLWVAKDRSGRDWPQLRPWDIARIVPFAVLAGLAALAAFFITTPYAFLDLTNFIADIREQAGMAGDAGRFPFTWQYADTPAFLYQIRQTAVWGLGLPLGIVAWVAAPVTAWFAWRGGITQRSDLLLLAWAVPALVFLELFEVKFLRYVFPLMPFYILMAAGMLVAFVIWARNRRRVVAGSAESPPDDAPFSEEWHATPPTVGDDLIFDEPLFGDEPFPDAPFSEEWHATPPLAGATVLTNSPQQSYSPVIASAVWQSRWNAVGSLINRYAYPVSIATVAIVLVATVLYAIAFVEVYGRTHTAIAASDWINGNVPRSASIINGGSYWDEQLPNLRGYDVWTFPAYHTDRDLDKIPELIERLADAGYVVFYSNRAYGSVARLPDEFPQSSTFYRLLFSGDLGYQLERAFTSYPTLAGVHLRDDPYGRAGLATPPIAPGGNVGQPDGVVINLGYADENVIGYDHPQALIFHNVEQLTERQIRERIDKAAESAASTEAPLMLSPSALKAQRSGGTWSEVSNRDGWANRVPWLSWLLVIELICLVAFPFTWWLMRRLPDRGILFARTLGLLLVAWVAWWLVNAGVMRFSVGTVWVAMFVVAIPSAVVLWRHWRLMLDWLREKWRLVLTAEALFLLAYLAFVMVRAANPDLWHPWRGGEKPMELAYFTAVARSSVLPPYDPWLSGGYLNYYYWGYFILSVPVRLTGIPPATAFNVAVPLLFALTATGAGSLVYNLVAVSSFRRKAKSGTPLSRGILDSRFRGNDVLKVGRWVPGGAAVAGMAAAVMATVSSNLDGVVQLAGMAQSKMQGMAAPLSNFDFWRSSRAIPESPEFEPSRLTPWLESDNFVETAFHITEFPFFTFLFADLHAHMMTMPFAVLALALGFALLVGLSRVSLRAPWPWVVVFVLALAVGSLWAINSWEYPAYVLLMLGCVAGGAWMMPGRIKTRLAVAAVLSLLALAVSYLAFQPFHAFNETFGTGIEPTRWRTPLSNYLLIHALPMLAAACLLSATLTRAIVPVLARVKGRQPIEVRDQWLLMGVSLGLVLACYFWAAGFVTVGFLTVALTLTAWALAACIASGEYPEGRADLMALAMLAMAFAIGIGVDLIRIEGDIARMNTLFKYYLVAWLLFAASGAYGLWRGWTAAATSGGFLRNTLRWIGAGVILTVFAGTLVYPALATPVRIADRFNPLPLTLDGTAWMPAAVYHPPDWCAEQPLKPIELKWDYEAIRWLQDNVSGTPVVLEGHGSQYCWNTRISQYTGLPTVLGWPWHQQQQRGDGEIVRRRARDVATMYSTPSHDRALELLEQYRVSYIVVGALERGYYDSRGIAKFDAMSDKGLLTLAYANDGTRIYQVPGN